MAPLRITAVTSANDEGIQKKIYGSRATTNLGAIYLGNMLTRKEAGYGNKEEKGILRAGYGSKKINFTQYFNKFLKHRSIIRMNLDLMEFISWCNKSWWIYRCWNSLDFFLCIK